MSLKTFIPTHHHLHAPDWELYHAIPVTYPEKPLRVQKLREGLGTLGFVEFAEQDAPIDAALLADIHAPQMMADLAEVSGRADELLAGDFKLYHMTDAIGTHKYIYPEVTASRPKMKSIRRSPRAKMGLYAFDSAAPIGSGTWTAAACSAQVAYDAAQHLLQNRTIQHAYALCRPPGHHAGRDHIGGYCYINNAALAAQALHTATGEKVAVLDIDYHHGNGTQDIFWRDGDIWFGSIHADPAHEYPFITGYADEIGEGDGRGTTLNKPLPLYCQESVWMSALDELLAAIASFAPRWLIISLGFDAHRDDDAAFFNVTTPAYEAVGAKIAALGLPTVHVQEGGYGYDILGEAVAAYFSGVMR